MTDRIVKHDFAADRKVSDILLDHEKRLQSIEKIMAAYMSLCFVSVFFNILRNKCSDKKEY